jgi:S-methylmethionine-dependent homocysteine/selenocysteine methylase
MNATRAKYRKSLPQMQGKLFATDGGLETTMLFHEGIELPAFAAFDLLKDTEGTARLRRYYTTYAQIARRHGLGLMLEAPTWRASRDWGRKLGYDDSALAAANRKAIALMEEIRAEFETAQTPVVISGNFGPRGDGYVATNRMSVVEAADYHGAQMRIFADSTADMVAAFTMNYVEEAIGIVQAAIHARLPVTISFTLETDGRLPSGQTLREAIVETDTATAHYPLYYMINCVHPTHFQHIFAGGKAVARENNSWIDRIRGLRANASCKSHAELDESTELDAGNPQELGRQYHELRNQLRRLAVVGGCCGTDHRHIEAICLAISEQSNARIGV